MDQSIIRVSKVRRVPRIPPSRCAGLSRTSAQELGDIQRGSELGASSPSDAPVETCKLTSRRPAAIAVACRDIDVRNVKALVIGPHETPYEFGFFEVRPVPGPAHSLRALTLLSSPCALTRVSDTRCATANPCPPPLPSS